MKMKMEQLSAFVNLTPHTIIIHTPVCPVEVPPSGRVARVSMTRVKVNMEQGVPLYVSIPGEVTDLPPEGFGRLFIVSAMVRQALPLREDLASPGALIRNDEGQPLGCEGLDISLPPGHGVYREVVTDEFENSPGSGDYVRTYAGDLSTTEEGCWEEPKLRRVTRRTRIH